MARVRYIGRSRTIRKPEGAIRKLSQQASEVLQDLKEAKKRGLYPGPRGGTWKAWEYSQKKRGHANAYASQWKRHADNVARFV